MIRRASQKLERLTYPVCDAPPSPLYRAAITAWIVFAVVVSVKMVVSPVKHNSFVAFETGARLWWAGLNPYHLSFNEYRYGPSFAVVFSPLLLLPMALGRLLWMGLNLAAYFMALRAAVRHLFPARWTPDREAVYLLLALVLSYRSLWTAQCNTLMFALVVFSMVALIARRRNRAAAWLAVPIHIKVWPLSAALLLIACRPRRLALPFVAALFGIGLLPFLTQPPGVVIERYADWVASLTGPMQVRHDYRDAWTIFEQLGLPIDRLSYGLLQLSTGLLALALCLDVKRRGATTPQLFTFILGVWTAWQLFVGPGSERATFALIAPMAAYAAVACFSTTSRWRPAIATALALMFLAGVGQFERALQGAFPLVRGAHPVGVVILAAWLVAHSRAWCGGTQIEIDITAVPLRRPATPIPRPKLALPRSIAARSPLL